MFSLFKKNKRKAFELEFSANLIIALAVLALIVIIILLFITKGSGAIAYLKGIFRLRAG